jgi:hypothetical protein
MIKKLLLVISLFFGIISYSQEIKTNTKSSLGDNIAYFIKNKLIPKEELVAIKPDEIASLNVIKRDTIIDKRRYSGQIFVVLKTSQKK